MKKVFTITLLSLSLGLFAQPTTLLFEDFNAGMPAGFTLRDLDGHTPEDTVAHINDAWVADTNAFNGDLVAVSTCFYTDGVFSDDWMITSSVVFTKNGVLSYKIARLNDADFSRVEVRIARDTAIDSFMATLPIDEVTPALSDYTGETRIVDLGALGYNNDTFYIAFRNNTTEFVHQHVELYIDSIHVYEVTTLDAAVTSADIGFIGSGVNHPVAGVLKNEGADTMRFFNLRWQIDGGTVNTDFIASENIAPQASYSFDHTTMLNVTATGEHTLKIWADSINGMEDQNHVNDTLEVSFYVMSEIPTKRVLLEQFSGTWHGWIPDGDYRVAQMEADNVIGVSIHLQDSMEILPPLGTTDVILEYSENLDPFRIGSNNRALIDRSGFNNLPYVDMAYPDTTSWKEKVDEQLNEITNVSLSATNSFDTIDRSWVIDVDVEFLAPGDGGEYRVNCYIVEDGVQGTGTLFDQTNLLNSTAGHPFEGAGDPIVDYEHNNVLRHAFGGTWGTAGSISGTIDANDEFDYQYNFPVGGIPETWAEANLSVVVFVQKFNNSDSSDRFVLNAFKMPLTYGSNSVGIELVADNNIDAKIYPNPVKDFAVIDLNLEERSEVRIDIYDITGRRVELLSQKILENGNHRYMINRSEMALNSGMYFVSIVTDDIAHVRRIIIE